MKTVKLSREEEIVMGKLTMDQLIAFEIIAEGNQFQSMKDLVNLLIDIEKELFLGHDEVDEKKLALDHAYARGGMGFLIKYLKIIAASTHEKASRQEGK